MEKPETKTSFFEKVFIISILFLTGITTTCTGGQNLILGWEPWEPFQSQSSNGSYTGLDLELVQIILSETDYEIEFK